MLLFSRRPTTLLTRERSERRRARRRAPRRVRRRSRRRHARRHRTRYVRYVCAVRVFPLHPLGRARVLLIRTVVASLRPLSRRAFPLALRQTSRHDEMRPRIRRFRVMSRQQLRETRRFIDRHGLLPLRPSPRQRHAHDASRRRRELAPRQIHPSHPLLVRAHRARDVSNEPFASRLVRHPHLTENASIARSHVEGRLE